MSLDFPATANALWAGFDAGKLPRPEYLLPCLYSESGFSTSVTNSIGCVGLDQLLPFRVAHPRRLRLVVCLAADRRAHHEHVRANDRQVRPPQLRHAHLPRQLPARIPLHRHKPVERSGQARRCRLRSQLGPGLPTQRAITVGDLSHFISRAASSTTVKNAIAQTYAYRRVLSPYDSVYGTDFGSPTGSPTGLSSSDWAIVAAGSVAAAVAGVVLAWDMGTFRR